MLVSYAQLGTDLLVHHIFDYKNDGVYVDVGCADPQHLSETYYLYEKGWSGLCIDATDKGQKYNIIRPKDTFVRAVVGQEGEATFNYFEPDIICTIKQKDYNLQGGYKFIREEKVKVIPLRDILKNNNISHIDLLSVDTEGNDLEVLKSHNWDIRPKVIVVEEYDFYAKKKLPEVGEYLLEKGYKKIGDSLIDGIYADEERYTKFYV